MKIIKNILKYFENVFSRSLAVVIAIRLDILKEMKTNIVFLRVNLLTLLWWVWCI